jgi:hypothetical protein
MKATSSPSAVADPAKEQEFVYGKKPPGPTPAPERIPLNTRIRGDFAKLLKRTSLERQLNGTQPNTLQEILEEALEPWMRSHGLPR